MRQIYLLYAIFVCLLYKANIFAIFVVCKATVWELLPVCTKTLGNFMSASAACIAHDTDIGQNKKKLRIVTRLHQDVGQLHVCQRGIDGTRHHIKKWLYIQ